MTAAIFPAYGIARTVLSQPWAVAAAVGAVAAPALSYSPILVEEPLAYLASTRCALAHPARHARPDAGGRSRSRSLAALVAAGVRSQLVRLVAVLAIVARRRRLAIGADARLAGVVEPMGLGRCGRAPRRRA